jgi:RHS repeat-associated protein
VSRHPAVGNGGALHRLRYDLMGRVESSEQFTDGTSFVFGYAYNYAGALTGMTYPSGRSLTITQDTAGRVGRVVGALDEHETTYAEGPDPNVNQGLIQYAAHGGMSGLKLGNGLVESTVYNSRLQPTSIQAGTLLTLGFDYGPSSTNNGNLLSQSITGAGGTFSQSYTYDAVNRLASAQEGATWSRTFGYDGFGNMWVEANSGVTLDPFTPTGPSSYDTATNRFVNAGLGISYDGVGNQTAIGGYTRSYDGENRQRTSAIGSAVTSYVYDGDGRRVKKVNNGATTVYVYDAAGQLAAEYATQPDPDPKCTTCYLTADHLGSTRLMTAATGTLNPADPDYIVRARHDYLPFGEEIPAGVGSRTTSLYPQDPLATANGNTIRFTGKERDSETGLDYFGARYFSGAQGRWTTPDWSAKPEPVPYAKLQDPQSLNLYGYVRNNPLTSRDLDGHKQHCFLGICVGSPEPPPPPPPPPAPALPGGFTVTLNSRPANIPLGSVIHAAGKDHQWITTSEGKSAGMGPAKNGGQVPGGNGQSTPDKPGDPTQVVDHSGEVATSTKTYTNVDRGAINSYLQVGRPTGPWIPQVNDCNSWAANAISESTPHDILSYASGGDPTIGWRVMSVQHDVVVYADGTVHKPGE